MSEFSLPNDDDYSQLAEQWVAVTNLIEEEYGVPVDQSESAIELLQRVLDDDLVGDNEYGLQCLGVALGRIMATNIVGLDWWIIDDEYGRDPCLRYNETTFQSNPITMISKRVLDGIKVDVRSLYDQTKLAVSKFAPTADP